MREEERAVASLRAQADLWQAAMSMGDRMQRIPTHGARDWEHFAVNGTHYLAVANQYNGTSNGIDSVIYVLGGNGLFQEFQRIRTDGAWDWEYFSANGSHYLAVANFYSGNSMYYGIQAVVYRLGDSGSFEESQRLPTTGALSLEHFQMDGAHYLAVANFYNGSSHNIDSAIYELGENGLFEDFQRIPTQGATCWEYFSADGSHYLAVANYMPNGTTVGDSVVFRRGEDGLFQEFQRIPTKGAFDWEYFAVDGAHYLAVANTYDGVDVDIDSVVYVRGDGGFFEDLQHIPTNSARDLEHFVVDGAHYLAIANFRTALNYSRSIDSVVYVLNEHGLLQEFQRIPTHGASDWEYFTVGRAHYLAVANTRKNASRNTDSAIYQRHLLWEF